MKKIFILGTGCPKCEKLLVNVNEAVKAENVEVEVEKVTDIQKIMAYGVMMTPALVVDGEVKSVGKVLSIQEIKAFL